MNEPTLPPELVSKPVVQETIPVDLNVARPISPEHIDRLKADLGHVQITGQRLTALRDLGMAGEQLGVIRTMKGGVLVSADALVQAIGKMEQIIEDPNSKFKEVKEASATLAALTNAYIRLSTGVVKMDRDVAEVVIARDEQKRNIFQPGRGMAGAGQSGHPPINV